MSQPQPHMLGGRYELGRAIGEGNFSVTYRATDTVLGREVAIKVLREQYLAHGGFASRFENEARAAASISHPNVIQVFDYGREDRTAYIVMQYVHGSSLKEYIRAEGPLSVDETTGFTRQILDGLAAIHAAGIIHRDVKPQNVLIGENRQLKLTDFGIARLKTGASGLTESGTAIGTAAYMAPEQAVGGTVTPATDLYSVGVMMYEMLTGRLPFPGDNPVQIMYRHVNETPPSPRSLNRDIPVAIESVVMAALSKEPEDRYPDALTMREALLNPSAAPLAFPREMAADPNERTAVTPTVGAAPPRVPPPPRRDVYAGGGGRGRDRWSTLLPILVFGALALLIAGIVAASQLDGDDGEEDAPIAVVDEPTATTEPTATLTPTIEPTATPEPTNTPLPPTATLTPTPEPPTPTPEPPTPTPAPPTPTPEPPTPTPEPPTPTPEPEPPDVPSVAFNTPFPIASLPTDVSQGPSATIDAGGFEGAYRRDDGQLYGLPAAHLYGQGSGARVATATFTVNEAPSEYVLIQLTGIDDEVTAKVPIRLSLNGNVVWEGPSPFQNGGTDFDSPQWWTDVGWLVANPEWLQEGQNTLTVEIIGVNGEIGVPPWVLLTSAVVYYQ